MNNTLKNLLKDGCLLIDNSSLERFTTCPRSAEYYLVNHRELAVSKAALFYGQTIHSALELRYANAISDMPTPELESAQARLIQQAYESVEIPEGEFRTAERAIEMCKKYNAHYPIESFEVVKKDGQPLVELPFAAPLGKIRLRGDFDVEVPVIWTGRIDMVIRVSEQLFVLDHKTTSMLGATYFSEFYNSNQMKGYIWYVQQALKTPVSGAFINALANRKPTKTGVAIEFARDKIYYDSTVIEEWPKNVLSICSNFLNQCEDDYFPMHEKWCVAKYGKCPYFEVCTLSPDQRPIMLNSGMYQNVTWNPLNPIKKNEIVS